MPLNVNANIPAMSANRHLLGAGRQVAGALQKLSSGLRVNTAKDGPAALVISELLRSQATGLQQAVRNTQEANNVLGIAEGGLSEVSGMLTRMRQLALHAANTGVSSPAQVAADQAELNGMLSAISRIAGSTDFSGQQLLDGSQAIDFRATDPGNILDTGASSISARADLAGQTFDIRFSGNAVDQAQKAYVETSLGGGQTLARDQEFTVTGEAGSRGFSFAAGTDLADVAGTINNHARETGVTAYVINGGTELRLVSNTYGSAAEVRVEQTQGNAFAATGATVTDRGRDATVTVAGQRVRTSGLQLRVQTEDVSGAFAFNAGNAANTTIAQTGYDQDTLVDADTARNVTVSDIKGGMRFQLGGGGDVQNRNIVGLPAAGPAALGRVDVGGRTYSLADLFGGGAASLANNPEIALQVIDQATRDVASQRAAIGAYQANTLQTNANALSVAIENVTATESAIRDTDMAAQVSRFVQAQLRERAGIMSVQSANLNARNVLKLLGG